MMLTPASVPWYWNKSQRQSLGWSRKNCFLALPGKGDTVNQRPQGHVCADPERVVTVQRARDQLTGILLIDRVRQLLQPVWQVTVIYEFPSPIFLKLLLKSYTGV